MVESTFDLNEYTRYDSFSLVLPSAIQENSQFLVNKDKSSFSYNSKTFSVNFQERNLKPNLDFDMRFGSLNLKKISNAESKAVPFDNVENKYDDSWSVSYSSVPFEANFSRFSLNQQTINAFSISNKTHTIEAASSNKPMYVRDYWRKLMPTDFYVFLTGKHYNIKFIDKYQELNYKDSKLNFSIASDSDRFEINTLYKFQSVNIRYLQYEDENIKRRYVNVYDGGFNLKSINFDQQLLQYKNITIARNNHDILLKFPIVDSKIKIHYYDGDLKYKIQNGLIGIDNGNPLIHMKFKNGEADVWFNKINYFKINQNIDKNMFSIEYHNDVQINDFDLNPNLLNVYNRQHFLTLDTVTNYKESLLFSFSNSLLNGQIDALNNTYRLSINNNHSSVFYNKNKKSDIIGFSESFKNGLITAEYDLMSSKFKSFKFGYSLKF